MGPYITGRGPPPTTFSEVSPPPSPRRFAPRPKRQQKNVMVTGGVIQHTWMDGLWMNEWMDEKHVYIYIIYINEYCKHIQKHIAKLVARLSLPELHLWDPLEGFTNESWLPKPNVQFSNDCQSYEALSKKKQGRQ